MDVLLSTRFDKKESGVYLRYLVNYLGGNIAFKLSRFSTLINDIKEGNPITPSDYGFDENEDADLGVMTESFYGDSYTLGVGGVEAQPQMKQRAPVAGKEDSSDSEPLKQESGEKKKGLSFLLGSKEKKGKLDELIESISGSGEKKKEKKGVLSGVLGTAKPKKAEPKKMGFEIPGEQFIPSGSRKKEDEKPKEESVNSRETNSRAPQSIPVGKQGKRPNNYGGTVFIAPSDIANEGESILGAEETPYITRLKDGLTYPITKEEYTIGRNKDEVDCFIDNATVGRTHAKIVCRNGVCEIYDLGSVNKTFVNGFRVAGNKSMKLQPGDRIRLSNEEFDFDYK